MSARSPRGSLSGGSSAAEIAEDFGESLKDLQTNLRLEIGNLTLIAKENTEHAYAISKTLENHIKTTAPSKKLPALYVLDSIVKNVGTPYTVYLGRNLYSTFMDAYTLVDSITRRNMKAMLKTWKEPVPGSMDTTPVFPLETVKPIESAFIKAETAALQSSRQVQTQPQPEFYRNTPTPPQYNGIFSAPPSQGQTQPYYGYGVHQPTPHQQNLPTTFSPAPNFQQPHLYAAQNQRPVNDLESVKRDLAVLITQRQAQAGANPFNHDLQQQLQTLQQLQIVLNSQSVNAGSLQQIRDQITALATQGPPQPKPTPQPHVSTQAQWQPPTSIPQPPHLIRPPVTYSQPPSVQPQPQAPFLAPGALSGLQALLANGQKPGTPLMRAAAPELQNASHTQLNNVQNQTAAAPALNGVDLIATLTKNGLLANLPAANPTLPAAAPSTPQPAQSTAALLQSLQGILPPVSQTGTPTQTPAQLAPHPNNPRIPTTAASLKHFRPELVHALYDAQPNQCSTCGRRFLATDEGRAKKARHLDWHFRTNQRMADASISRGAHRDWYPTELEWIQLRDFDPSTTTTTDRNHNTATAAIAAAKKGPQDSYVRAPAGVTKNVCSICYEEMRASYSEDLQEWIFTNATTYGGKIVHATCLAEMQKGQQGGGGGSLAAALAGAGLRQRSATPEPKLGKRKADGSLGGAGVGSRLRMD